jgi:hypothetical protein
MDYRLMFKGDYIQAVEFGDKQPTVEIASVRLCKMDDEKKGRQVDKCVVFFKGRDRGWVICKTNAMCLAGMFGNDTTGWVGKRVTIYSTLVAFGKEKVPGIRVKGSPDISKPVEVTVKLPRKKPIVMRMQVTKPGAAPAPEPEPEPEAEPESAPEEIVDPETGEVFPA